VNIISPTPICIGDTVSLKVQYQPATYYEWKTTSGNILDESNNILKMLYDTVGVFQVNVSALNECGSSQNSRSVNVRDIPDVLANSDVVICEGLPVTLSASSSSAESFFWTTFGSAPLGNQSSLTLVADSTRDYIVTAINSYGCKNRDTVNVEVIENPNTLVTFTQSDTLGCAPFSVTLTNTTVSAIECVWNISNGQVINGCGPVIVELSDPGCYDITLLTTDSNQCPSTSVEDDAVCAESPPTAQFSSSESLLSVYDTEVEFYNESTGATNYEWTFGADNQVYSDEHPSHKFPYDELADYAVKLVAISSIGCRDTAYALITMKEELLFYVPNAFTPNEDEFNQTFKPVFTSGFDPREYSLYIFNRWGELIFESRNAEVGWDGSYMSTNSAQDITFCDEGTYTWRIEFVVSEYNSPKTVSGHVNLVR
jgi:gliding motility-associated-like protein